MKIRLFLLVCLFALTSIYAWGLAGVYTINPMLPPTASNFQSFTAAINALNSSYPTAPVTFNVKAGAYFYEACPTIYAASFPPLAVVFQKDDPNMQNAGLISLSTAAGFKLVGGDYFTFDGIDVLATTSNCPYGFFLDGTGGNGAHHNTIKNCRIVMNQSFDNTIGIYQLCVSAGYMEASNSNNTYENVSIENSFSGIVLDHQNASSGFYDQNCVIKNCTIGAPSMVLMTGASTRYGIYTRGQNSLIIENNEIRNIVSQNAESYGIHLYTTRGESHIRGNKIHGIHSANATSLKAQYGMRVDLGTEANVEKKLKIYNNMIWDMQNPFSSSSSLGVCGIYVYGVYNLNKYYVDFNTICLQTAPGSVTHGLFFYNAGGQHFVRNNIIQVMSPGATRTHACIRYYDNPMGAAGSVADYNVLYAGGLTNCYAVHVNMGNDFYADVTSWNAASGLDQHSYSTDPLLISIYELHLQNGVDSDALHGGSYFAGALNWVSTDIDGNNRDATNPDIGADELYVASPPEVPIVQISQADGSILLSWDAVQGATSYRIEASDEPTAGFSLLGTSTTTNYTDTITTKKFYRVIAVAE